MTSSAPALRDPQLEAFYAADPARQFERPEQAAPAERPEHRHALELGIALAAAFLVVRRLVATDLTAGPPPTDINGAANRLWRRYAPVWLRLVVPALIHAYSQGATSSLTESELEALAARYAGDLGDYLSTSSAQALSEGFNAQLSQRWSERIAWQRAGMAYGLDRQQMLSHIGGLMKASEAGGRDPVSDAARALVDKALLVRADAIGQTESWRFLQAGKAIAWLARQQAGDLSAEAVKEWDTAHGETPCEICGPLDGVQVPLAGGWDTSAGLLFAPGAHPNCRCRIRLVDPVAKVAPRSEPIRKDMPGDPFDRDREGRFARREQRKPARPSVSPPVRERDPEVDAIMEQARRIAEEDAVDPFARTPATKPADPFTRTADPFVRTARLGDPFARSGDPFARTGSAVDPFARTGRKTADAADRRKILAALTRSPRPGAKRRSSAVTNHVLIVPPLPVREEASHAPYYLPVTDMQDLLHAQNAGLSPDKALFGELEDPSYLPGDTVDFKTQLATATYFWEMRRDWAEQIRTERGDPLTDDPTDLQHFDADTYIPPKPQPLTAVASSNFVHLGDTAEDATRSFFADREGLVRATRGEALRNAEAVADQLDPDDWQVIFYLAGSLSPGSPDAAFEIFDRHLGEGDNPDLGQAFVDYVTYCRPELTGANGEDLARELRDVLPGGGLIYPNVAEIFVFDRGFAPGDATQGESALADIAGEYQVEEVEYHSAAAQLGLYDNPGLAGYRLVYLRPKE